MPFHLSQRSPPSSLKRKCTQPSHRLDWYGFGKEKDSACYSTRIHVSSWCSPLISVVYKTRSLPYSKRCWSHNLPQPGSKVAAKVGRQTCPWPHQFCWNLHQQDDIRQNCRPHQVEFPHISQHPIPCPFKKKRNLYLSRARMWGWSSWRSNGLGNIRIQSFFQYRGALWYCILYVNLDT